VSAARFAELLGFEGIKVTTPDEVGPAWDRAFAANGPVVLEFVTDKNVPPLPPHVRFEQMKKTAKGLLGGDEGAKEVAVEGFKGKLAEFAEHLPGRGE
jgi:pyruvate dehydrogenase (quinone)